MKIAKKAKNTILTIIFLILFAAGVFFAGTIYAGKDSDPVITSTSLTSQLQEIQNLTVLEYNYTKVGKFENSLELNGWDIPLTKKSFLLTYSGKLQAGVDMREIEIVVDNDKIIVSLPEVKIMNHIMDEESIEVYDETKNIFNPISINDYKTFAVKQKALVEEEAIEKGFLSEAATRTQSVIKSFLETISDIKENYTIEVRFK